MAKQKIYEGQENVLMTQNAKIHFFILILFVGMVCSIVFHYINGAYLNSGYPYSTFLFLPSNFFNDFFHPFKALSIYGNPYSYYSHTGVVIPYLPFTFVILKILTPLDPYFALYLLLALFVAYVVGYFYKSVFSSEQDPFLRILFTVIFTFCSYPFLFLLDRANVEIFTFIALTLFFIFYQKESSLFWAPLFLAVAIAMKLYPGVLALLFFADKRYKDITITAIFTIAIIFLSYTFIAITAGVDILTVISNNLQQLSLHKPLYGFSFAGLQHNHTLWGFILGLNEYYRHFKGSILFDYNLASNLYLGFIMIICIVYTVYTIYSRDVVWKKAVVLMSAMLIFPYTSFDYSLVHWMICVGLYLSYDGEETRFERILYIVLFAVPLIPLDYKYVLKDASITIFLYPCAIMAFAVFIVFKSFVAHYEDKYCKVSQEFQKEQQQIT